MNKVSLNNNATKKQFHQKPLLNQVLLEPVSEITIISVPKFSNKCLNNPNPTRDNLSL